MTAMHDFRRFIQEQMDARGWDRSELRQRSGLSRQQIHRLLTDDRDQLPERPEPRTIEALANAFGPGSERALWMRVAIAMGLPVGELLVAEPALIPDDDLIRELEARLRNRREDAATGRQTRIVARQYEDTRQISAALRRGDTVIMDLSQLDTPVAKRLVDFAAGAALALGLRMERVSARSFRLEKAGAPSAVDLAWAPDTSYAELPTAAMQDNPGDALPGQSEEPDA